MKNLDYILDVTLLVYSPFCRRKENSCFFTTYWSLFPLAFLFSTIKKEKMRNI